MDAQGLRSPLGRSRHVIAGLIAALVGLASGAIAQTTIYVDCASPDCANADGSQANPYCTIQEGIDAAVDGDTVVVAACTYNEKINYNGKTIAVISASGADVTILDGGGSGPVVRITGGEATGTLLDGFTVTNGSAFNGGAGILIGGTATPTIRNNTITGNTSTRFGGGVLCEGTSNVTFISNVIASNTTSFYAGGGVAVFSAASFSNDTISQNQTISPNYGNGAGIYGSSASSLTVTGATFTGNVAGYEGGGIFALGSLTVASTAFQGNEAVLSGGAVKAEGSVTMVDCELSSNTARFGGGGAFLRASGSIRDTRIHGNTAWQGGGVSSARSGLTLINSTIAGNVATNEVYGSGGGIGVSQGDVRLSNCTVVDNTAGTTGGGVSGSFTASNSIFWGNTPDQLNAAPTITFSDVQGGFAGTGNIDADPIFEDAPSGDYHLSLGSPCVNTGDNTDPDLQPTDFEGDARIIDGIVDMGADEFACAGVPAFLFVDASNASCPGSGTELDPYCTIQMAIDNSCSGDTITVGPGTYFENLDLKGRDLIIRGSAGAHETILNGGGLGPVIRFEYGADATLDGFTLRDGLNTNGGGIVCRNSSPILINCVVTDCQAFLNGGAIYCQAGDPTLLNVTFTQNAAGALGGAIYSTGSSAVVATNSILWGNTPDAVSGDTATITFSDVEGGYVGAGNIDLDPEFLDPANADWRLSCASPCIDAGTDAVTLLAFDFEGDPRQADGDSDGSSQPDMGADEFDELFVFFDVLGDLTGFVAQAPPGSTGDTGFVLISFGNGASGGVPLPYGEVLDLDIDPLFNAWLLSIPAVFRTVTVQGCPGSATGLLPVPIGFTGFTGYYAGFFTDGATSFRATPTKRFVLP